MAAFALSLLQKASAPEGFTPQLPFINEFRFDALDYDDGDDGDGDGDAFDDNNAPKKAAKINRPLFKKSCHNIYNVYVTANMDNMLV